MLPLSYLRTVIESSRREVSRRFEQSLHGADAPARCMADGWRRFLEEESEHQWLTLSLFALFVVFGAFAIDATEHFVGDRITPITTELDGALVVDIIPRATPPTPPSCTHQRRISHVYRTC